MIERGDEVERTSQEELSYRCSETTLRGASSRQAQESNTVSKEARQQTPQHAPKTGRQECLESAACRKNASIIVTHE